VTDRTKIRIISIITSGYAIIGWGCIFALAQGFKWPLWATGLATFAGTFAWGYIALLIRNAVLAYGGWRK
jgi:hypothetical protein